MGKKSATNKSVVLPTLRPPDDSHHRLLSKISAHDAAEAAVHRSSAGALARVRQGSGVVRGVLGGEKHQRQTGSRSAMSLRSGALESASAQPRSSSSLATVGPPLGTNEAARLVLIKQRGVSTGGINASLPEVTSTSILRGGLALATKIAGFQELESHKVFNADVSSECHLSLSVIQRIFDAKMADAALARHGGRAHMLGDGGEGYPDGGDRLLRFVDYVSTTCVGLQFNLSGCGLGERGLAAAVDALIDDHRRQVEYDAAIRQATNTTTTPHVNLAASTTTADNGQGRRGLISAGMIPPASPTSAVVPPQNPLSTRELQQLYTACYECPPYACVDISENTSPNVGHELARLVANNSSIVALAARSVSLSPSNGACAFFYNLGAMNNTIVELDLSGDATGSARNAIWGAAGMALAQMVRDNQVLARLNLAHCGLEPSELIALFKACSTHSALLALNISGNGLGSLSVCRALGQMLSAGANQLEDLSMSRCRITDKGIAVIALALEEPYLDAEDAAPVSVPLVRGRGGGLATGDPQSPVSASATASSFNGFVPVRPAQEFVTHLDLSHNLIEGHGLQIFAKYVPRLASLRRLNMSHNMLGSMGCDVEGMRLAESSVPLDELVRSLSSMSSLQSLDLSHCDLVRIPADMGRLLTPSYARKHRATPHQGRSSAAGGRRASNQSDGVKIDTSHLLDGPSDGPAAAFPDSEDTFRELHLSNNPRLGDDGAVALAEAIRISGAARIYLPDISSPHSQPSSPTANHGGRERGGMRPAATTTVGPQYLPLKLLSLFNCGISQDGMQMLLDALSPDIPTAFRSQEGDQSNATINTRSGGGGRLTRTFSTASAATNTEAATASRVSATRTHGFPVRSLRLLQGHWKGWRGPLVDSMVRIPCLESVDLGKFSTPQLNNVLAKNLAARSEQAKPEYDRHVKLVAREDALIGEANDHVKDEKRATERALENVKNARERQKAALAALEQECHQLRVQKGVQQGESSEAVQRVNDALDHLNDKRSQMDLAKSRLLKRIETVETAKRDFLAQLKSIKNKENKHAQQVATAIGDCKRGNERQYKNQLAGLFGGSSNPSRKTSFVQQRRASVDGGGSQLPTHRESVVYDASASLPPSAMLDSQEASSLAPFAAPINPFSIGSQSAVMAEVQMFLWEQQLEGLLAEVAELKSTAMLYEAKIKAAHARFPTEIPEPTSTWGAPFQVESAAPDASPTTKPSVAENNKAGSAAAAKATNKRVVAKK